MCKHTQVWGDGLLAAALDASLPVIVYNHHHHHHHHHHYQELQHHALALMMTLRHSSPSSHRYRLAPSPDQTFFLLLRLLLVGHCCLPKVCRQVARW